MVLLVFTGDTVYIHAIRMGDLGESKGIGKGFLGIRVRVRFLEISIFGNSKFLHFAIIFVQKELIGNSSVFLLL